MLILNLKNIHAAFFLEAELFWKESFLGESLGEGLFGSSRFLVADRSVIRCEDWVGDLWVLDPEVLDGLTCSSFLKAKIIVKSKIEKETPT